jgi:hypothetical protein
LKEVSYGLGLRMIDWQFYGRFVTSLVCVSFSACLLAAATTVARELIIILSDIIKLWWLLLH